MDIERERIAAALSGYELGEELGRGAFGIVIAGRHTQLDREVAIKQLPPGVLSDPVVRRRFVSEARVLAGLDHPHVVRIYDFVQQDGLLLFVMERLTGGNLRARMVPRLSPPEACAIVLATCIALQHAHTRGVLHRDIKPDNLMFDADGVLKVTDFGIAKVLDESASALTKTGTLLGTPAYIAPEQAETGKATRATDVFATSVVLFELLSGRLPYPATANAVVALLQRVHLEPESLSTVAPDTVPSIAAVVMRGLAVDPAQRFATASELGAALDEAAADAWGREWLAATGLRVWGLDELRSGGLGEMPCIDR